ncbi:MAG: hypothetical protein K9M54_09255 [Kiritimatiellales bacterium]|nr:hypothetical protein [Kiritimatiellales bacterium]MCF7863903.1 hypothetical protein [Kiritimatiellales bacterium]
MQSIDKQIFKPFQPIEDRLLLDALNALGRSINIVSTYGNHHPAFHQAIAAALLSMQALFIDRKKFTLGAFNGVMTVDEIPIQAAGTLLKSLERRLVRLQITCLRVAQGISEEELTKLAELLACNEVENFNTGMTQAGLLHIAAENTRFQAVRDGQTVANNGDLAGGGHGVLVLDDGLDGDSASMGSGGASVHVDQIVAFLKGDIDHDADGVGEALTELASDPARLGQMIMESVSIRQTASALSGESLSDVILGCLRRTYDGLRKQPAFQCSEGVADLKKALLLLEENILDKMRDLAGDSDPEVDRQIVQAIREMDENLGFELAASQYMEHREAIEENKKQLQSYVKTKGVGMAEELLGNTGFPSSDWRKIVVESQNPGGSAQPPIAAGLSTLTMVFEKLETLMKSNNSDTSKMKDLLGQANHNLDDTIDSTREKLEHLSVQLLRSKEDTGTIGGQAATMDRKELLTSIAEIAQELMQPLTAISASLEMMLGGYVGTINLEQRTILDLANNSGAHLTFLMKELISIVGCPTNKGTDDRFHTTSEQVVLMEQKKAV